MGRRLIAQPDGFPHREAWLLVLSPRFVEIYSRDESAVVESIELAPEYADLIGALWISETRVLGATRCGALLLGRRGVAGWEEAYDFGGNLSLLSVDPCDSRSPRTELRVVCGGPWIPLTLLCVPLLETEEVRVRAARRLTAGREGSSPMVFYRLSTRTMLMGDNEGRVALMFQDDSEDLRVGKSFFLPRGELLLASWLTPRNDCLLLGSRGSIVHLESSTLAWIKIGSLEISSSDSRLVGAVGWPSAAVDEALFELLVWNEHGRVDHVCCSSSKGVVSRQRLSFISSVSCIEVSAPSDDVRMTLLTRTGRVFPDVALAGLLASSNDTSVASTADLLDRLQEREEIEAAAKRKGFALQDKLARANYALESARAILERRRTAASPAGVCVKLVRDDYNSMLSKLRVELSPAHPLHHQSSVYLRALPGEGEEEEEVQLSAMSLVCGRDLPIPIRRLSRSELQAFACFSNGWSSVFVDRLTYDFLEDPMGWVSGFQRKSQSNGSLVTLEGWLRSAFTFQPLAIQWLGTLDELSQALCFDEAWSSDGRTSPSTRTYSLVRLDQLWIRVVLERALHQVVEIATTVANPWIGALFRSALIRRLKKSSHFRGVLPRALGSGLRTRCALRARDALNAWLMDADRTEAHAQRAKQVAVDAACRAWAAARGMTPALSL